MEIEKVKRMLLPAIRQYRHNAVPINDQDKFVCGYDYDETNKIMADSLANPIEPLVMEKIAVVDLEYYKACSKIIEQILRQIPNAVFQQLEIDGEVAKRVCYHNGYSFEDTIGQYFH